jgi:hypothetical protein
MSIAGKPILMITAALCATSTEVLLLITMDLPLMR